MNQSHSSATLMFTTAMLTTAATVTTSVVATTLTTAATAVTITTAATAGTLNTADTTFTITCSPADSCCGLRFSTQCEQRCHCFGPEAHGNQQRTQLSMKKRRRNTAQSLLCAGTVHYSSQTRNLLRTLVK